MIEDPNVAVVMIMRMFERTLAVAIGGIAIYLGYRLFVLLPTQTDSSGKIELPGYSVVLSKVGPGVFFAGFGTMVLYLSFTSQISISSEGGDLGFVGGFSLYMPPIENPPDSNSLVQAVTPQEREQVRQSIQMLNCLERIVNSSGDIRSDDVEGPVRDARVALLESIWNRESWGSPEAFYRWAASKEGQVPNELSDMYLGELPGCPK